jgi:hypothetical protein
MKTSEPLFESAAFHQKSSNSPTHGQIQSSEKMQMEIAKRAATSSDIGNMTKFDSTMTREQIVEKMHRIIEQISKR